MRLLVLLAGVALASGCTATSVKTSFDTSRRIEKDAWEYRQDGVLLEHTDMVRKLKDHPAAQSDLEGYEALTSASAVLNFTGGLLYIAGLLTLSGPLQAAGGTLVLASLVAVLRANADVARAVEAYNRSLEGIRPATAQSTLDETRPSAASLPGAGMGSGADAVP